MVTADHRINRKCILGHFYNSRDPTPDWFANFAIAKISAGSIFTDSQNFGPRNNNPLYGRQVYKPLFIHVTYSVYVSYKNITPGC